MRIATGAQEGNLGNELTTRDFILIGKGSDFEWSQHQFGGQKFPDKNPEQMASSLPPVEEISPIAMRLEMRFP